MRSPLFPTWIRLLTALLIVSFLLYAYINKQNKIAELRFKIPELTQEVHEIEEENVRLTYEIETFEDPVHLMELARKPEFRHLKQPPSNEIVSIPLQMRKKQ